MGHYFFFLDDNYIGQAPDGSVQFISSDPNTGCPGAMNDPYTDFLTKYQPQASWLPGCDNTYSQQTLGRSDWATIVAHYPWLHAPTVPIQQINPGPSGQRLAFTQFEVVPPPAAATDRQTLGVPIFTIATSGGRAYQPSPSARGFLLQDQRLVELGAPSLDQLVARGAALAIHSACSSLTTSAPATRPPHWAKTSLSSSRCSTGSRRSFSRPSPRVRSPSRWQDWQRACRSRPSSIPRNGDATALLDLTPAPGGYGGTFSLPVPVFEGSLRIWDANNPLRQVITGFILGSDPTRWDSRDPRWRSRLCRWRSPPCPRHLQWR